MRVSFYFNHHESMGHTTRAVSILEGLKKYFGDDIEILILHGGKKQEFMNLHKYGRVVNLPFPIGREFFYRYDLLCKLMSMENRI